MNCCHGNCQQGRLCDESFRATRRALGLPEDPLAEGAWVAPFHRALAFAAAVCVLMTVVAARAA